MSKEIGKLLPWVPIYKSNSCMTKNTDMKFQIYTRYNYLFSLLLTAFCQLSMIKTALHWDIFISMLYSRISNACGHASDIATQWHKRKKRHLKVNIWFLTTEYCLYKMSSQRYFIYTLKRLDFDWYLIVST